MYAHIPPPLRCVSPRLIPVRRFFSQFLTFFYTLIDLNGNYNSRDRWCLLFSILRDPVNADTLSVSFTKGVRTPVFLSEIIDGMLLI